jgi:hypothetical protein
MSNQSRGFTAIHLPLDIDAQTINHDLDQEVRRNGHGVVDLPVRHRQPWGRLWAEANEPRGAVFQFTLPGA